MSSPNVSTPQGTILSDMSRCEPAAALSPERTEGKWRLVEYETMDGIKGVMAFAAPDENVPEIRLPIALQGRHRIFVGINYTRAPYHDGLHRSEWPIYGQVQLALEGDPGFTRFAAEAGWQRTPNKERIGKDSDVYRSMQEAYWKTADLTGVRHIRIATMGEPYIRDGLGQIANVSYLRFEPLDSAAEAAWRTLEPSPGTKRLALIWCSGMLSGHAMGNLPYHPTDPQWIRDELTPFVGNDVGLIIFEAIRGNLCCFRTETGDIGSPDERWHDDWIDPLAEAVKFGHEHGLKVAVGLRMMGPGYPMIDAPIARARFYWQHMEWAKRTRDGQPCTNLSIAFPQVRQHWLALLREALTRGADGVHLHLQRSQPFVMFEEPVVKDFQAKHGIDPRTLENDDRRLIEHQAGYLTQFLREVRAVADEKRGRTVGVTFYGEPHKYDKRAEFDPLYYNCDVDRWIDEKLVDFLVPSPAVPLDMLSKWKKRGAGKVQFWVDMQPRTQDGVKFVQQARRYYEAGADGLAFWDGERRPPHASEWAVERRLGHKDDLDLLEREAPGLYRRVPLKKLGPFYAPDSFHDG